MNWVSDAEVLVSSTKSAMDDEQMDDEQTMAMEGSRAGGRQAQRDLWHRGMLSHCPSRLVGALLLSLPQKPAHQTYRLV